MKNSKILLIALSLLCTIGLNFILAQTNSQLSPQIKQKTFEKVWQTVNDKYFDATFGGVDWRAIGERYRRQIASTKTEAEFYELLNRMLGELKASHLEVITPEDVANSEKPPTITGIGLREIENQIVVSGLLANSSAMKAGLKPGYALTKIGGETIKTLKDANDKLDGEAGTTVEVEYLDERDQPHRATLKRETLENLSKSEVAKGVSFYARFEQKRLAENIGYIHFTSFIASLNEKIRAAIESMRDAPGIIIDLRGNGGGDDDVAIKMANLLFDRKVQLMITRTRKGDDLYYKTTPAKNPYRGKVIVLIDEKSGSASEQFAVAMQESGRATIVGKTSAGEDLDADLLKLPSGAYLIYPYGQPHTPKGVVIEGRGVRPDIEVSITRRDLLSRRDSQLEAAIEAIKNGK